MLRIGIDIGGTFTDFVVYDPKSGNITTFKVLSTPSNPALAVLQGLQKVLSGNTAQIIHGSTVATNALLERKGARTALITTRGFRDVLQIGRQNRPELYDWSKEPPPVLVASELRYEVDERIDSGGNVIQPLDASQIKSIITTCTQARIESVAVCLLFSFLHPQHEQMISEHLRAAGFLVSSSSEILPEYREYERTSTTVINAYVSPILEGYLSTLEDNLPNIPMHIMQSNGGMISFKEARRNGARCILSGPAGGIVGAQYISKLIIRNQSKQHPAEKVRVITFDMGGTSTDVSLIDGEPKLTTEAIVGGCPIHLPLLDIHTIGAGGGSIAYIDAGGSLRVGPQSAGADPGPACYGHGDLPTVTDANVVLGRIVPEYFLGGQMQLEPERSFTALSHLGKQLNMSPTKAALGVIDVVDAQMERALRVISVERGHDPREYSLFSFGGAGGLHAGNLARNLGVPHLIVSRLASTLSAFGMIVADVVKDYVQTIMLSGDIPLTRINQLFAPLVERGSIEVMGEGILAKDLIIQRYLDIRYIGQSYELTIPWSENIHSAFNAAHQSAYGYSNLNTPIEIVNLRVRVTGVVHPPQLPALPFEQNDPKQSILKYHQVVFGDGTTQIPFYSYDLLKPGNLINGPAAIVRSDTTILIGKNDSIEVDQYQNLCITIGK